MRNILLGILLATLVQAAVLPAIDKMVYVACELTCDVGDPTNNTLPQVYFILRGIDF